MAAEDPPVEDVAEAAPEGAPEFGPESGPSADAPRRMGWGRRIARWAGGLVIAFVGAVILLGIVNLVQRKNIR